MYLANIDFTGFKIDIFVFLYSKFSFILECNFKKKTFTVKYKSKKS